MPRISLQGFFAAATAGWAALETTLAVWFFVIPHGSNFALEIGPAASFAVFSWVYTIGYLALFILLVLPMTILLTKSGEHDRQEIITARIRRSFRASVGSLRMADQFDTKRLF